ncbi:MAG: hypothetical protein WAU63_00790 [Methylovirgula sp.]
MIVDLLQIAAAWIDHRRRDRTPDVLTQPVRSPLAAAVEIDQADRRQHAAQNNEGGHHPKRVAQIAEQFWECALS